MPVPSEITGSIERLTQELNQIEQEATAGLNMIRERLARFPENFALIELLAFLNTSLFFVETARRGIQERLETLSSSEVITTEAIQEEGEQLSMELGRAMETKIRVSRIKERLER